MLTFSGERDDHFLMMTVFIQSRSHLTDVAEMQKRCSHTKYRNILDTHGAASCTGLPCIVSRLPSTLIVPSLFANRV